MCVCEYMCIYIQCIYIFDPPLHLNCTVPHNGTKTRRGRKQFLTGLMPLLDLEILRKAVKLGWPQRRNRLVNEVWTWIDG